MPDSERDSAPDSERDSAPDSKPKKPPPAELAPSWPAVRRGLSVWATTWAALTLASIGIQLWSTQLIVTARSGGAPAAEVFARVAGVNVVYQGAYIAVAAVLCGAGLAMTRAPMASRAVRPALVATVGFGVVAVLAFVLLRTDLAGLNHDQPEVRGTLAVFGAARVIALLSLIVACTQLQSHCRSKPPPALPALAYALVIADASIALYRVISGAPSSLQTDNPWLYRALVVVVQASAAVALILLTLRTRRAIAAFAPADEASAEASDDSNEQRAPKRRPVRKRAAPPSRALDAQDAPDSTPAEHAVLRRPEAALLFFVGAAGLPIWDAVVQGSALTPFVSDAQRVSNFVLSIPLIVLVLAVILYRSMAASPYAARGVFIVGLLLGGGYAVLSARDLATTRSHEIDSWPICETGSTTPSGAPAQIRTRNVDGPTTTDGTPCVEGVEMREAHNVKNPEGNVRDGIIQIWTRFREDRMRFFVGTLLSLLLLGLAGRFVFRAAPADESLE